MDAVRLYDIQHETEYYQTLRAWLLASGDVNAASGRLHIHRNTVIYRLQRITELFEIDLKDFRNITAMYVSLFTGLPVAGTEEALLR